MNSFAYLNQIPTHVCNFAPFLDDRLRCERLVRWEAVAS